MTIRMKIIAIVSLAAISALLLGACGVAQLPAISQPTVAPGNAAWPGMMGGGGMMGNGHMGNGMMGGGMMGGYDDSPSAPTAEPTPVGATPVPVDMEIQITASNSRFSRAQISVKPGETVRFVVTNGDPFIHNFGSQEAGIPFINLPGNTTGAVTWTAPAQTGTLLAICTLHPGMSLTLVIED